MLTRQRQIARLKICIRQTREQWGGALLFDVLNVQQSADGGIILARRHLRQT
jgi:hypothetical protein